MTWLLCSRVVHGVISMLLFLIFGCQDGFWAFDPLTYSKNVQKKTAFSSENGRKLEIKGLLVKQLLGLIEITISIKHAQLSSIMLINRRRRWAHLEIAKIFLIYCGKTY